jgi:DNA repair exonuclease SbcCD ATPase subunit
MYSEDTREEIEHQQALIKQYTINLRDLEKQAAQFGLTIPTNIQNAMSVEKSRITESQQRLLKLQAQSLQTQTTVSELKMLIDQFSTRISALETIIHDIRQSMKQIDPLVITVATIKNVIEIFRYDSGASSDIRTPFVPFSWNPSSDILAVIDWDKLLFIDNKGQVLKIFVYKNHKDNTDNAVVFMSWSPDGRYLTLRDYNGVTIVWGVNYTDK